MSYNIGKVGKNHRNNQDRSYGIFGEDTSFISHKLPIKGFKREEEEELPAKKMPQNQNVINNAKPKVMPAQRSAVQVNSSPKNFFVFDIETVPCIQTARTLLNLGQDVSEDEVATKLTAYHSEITGGANEFHRQLFHKVVCVSFIAGTIYPLKGGKEKYIVKTIRSGGRNGESEEEILQGVFSYLSKHPSRLISFNGRGFDMPVLQYRAMKYGIDARWIYNDGYYNYNHRYSIEKHCDLLEMFSNFGASARVKMSEVSALFKIPCKNNGVDGSNVYSLFKEGKLNEIADYCESDVISTYVLYLRFMQHSGKLSAEGYNIVLDNLINLLNQEGSPDAHKLFASQFLAMNDGNIHLKLHNKQEQTTQTEEQTEEATQAEEQAEEITQDEEFIIAEESSEEQSSI